ncbi:tRNA epoxyqueuosine(34) reductase QueG [Comamonas serinivorans]|uniref:tRNA epoxyqueuosine(34) reductase QueG n=2 Tax=Comamonas serinivorans TaxID=1082851 RepID=A0A1Y0ESM0_9BURK|nr:tRNA epoxyqueuosine(34) reductase QueG [Comamonas serinivorans]
MAYMAAHGLKRARPAELVPGTVSVISVRMNYLPRAALQAADGAALAGQPTSPVAEANDLAAVPSTVAMPAATAAAGATTGWRQREWQSLQAPGDGVVSLYARGRDYHKVVRNRLQQLQRRMAEQLGPFGHRVFCDSAPVLEAELATRAGLGWRGKHSLVLSRDAGSLFFLGELFVDLALPATSAQAGHCGQCTSCITSCPTGAIVAPYRVDARRCISYLTIEHAGPIDPALRPLVGNHVYGCDDCQLACPWNKFAQASDLPDFDARPDLQAGQLVRWMQWDEAEFLRLTEGSPIRRIGHARWLRNVALVMGNAASAPLTTTQRRDVVQALARWQDHADPVVREQVAWSLARHGADAGPGDR